MFKYIIKIILFLTPLLLILVFPFFVYVYGREFTSLKEAIKLQKGNSSVLFLPAYDQKVKAFKTLSIASRNPEIIILGSSRVYTFQSSLFKPDIDFYNAGGIGGFAQDFTDLMIRMPKNSRLKVIIAGIDQRLVNPTFVTLGERDNKQNPPEDISLTDRLNNFLAGGWILPYQDYFSGKFSLSQLIRQHRETQNIGISALIDEMGFRSDGSLTRGRTLKNPDQIKEVITEKVNNIFTPTMGMYQYNTGISEEGIKLIEEFLLLAHERDIYIVGFTSPYASEIYDKLLSLNNQYTPTMFEIPKRLEILFKKYGYHFYGLDDVRSYGSSDDELIDQDHITEKGAARLLLYVAEHDKIINRYTDIDQLKNLIR